MSEIVFFENLLKEDYLTGGFKKQGVPSLIYLSFEAFLTYLSLDI